MDSNTKENASCQQVSKVMLFHAQLSFDFTLLFSSFNVRLSFIIILYLKLLFMKCNGGCERGINKMDSSRSRFINIRVNTLGKV